MKILVIGLDAATMDLIDPWAAGGHLPALEGLMRNGASGRLLSTPNMHSASAWTSILTGLNPGRHGLFVFSDRDFETGKQVFFKGGNRTGDLISAHLSHHRLTSGFLNVPMTYPAHCEPGGFMISGLDAPSLNEHAFCPTGLRDELFAKFPNYRFSPSGLGDLMKAGQVDRAINSWLELIETQTDVAAHLMATRPVHFFMTVYTASDWAGHNLWNDSNNPPDKNRLLRIYRALDAAIERLLAYCNSETQVFVISDHGMGRHSGASYHLAEWLETHGYMVRKGGKRSRHSLLNASRKAARSMLPISVRERLRAGIGEERISRLQAAEKDSFYASVDWTHTVAYTEPGRHVININLQGRNAAGKVPLNEYQDVCSRIINELGEWVDDNANRVVESVDRRGDVYSGPFTERASDLYVNWNQAANFHEPPAEVRDRGFWWSGDHRREGILICNGAGIDSTKLVARATVCDLVPTMLYAAGLPVPNMLDGRVIKEAFTAAFLDSHPLQLESSCPPGVANDVKLSPDEEQLVEEKLRGLGYL